MLDRAFNWVAGGGIAMSIGQMSVAISPVFGLENPFSDPSTVWHVGSLLNALILGAGYAILLQRKRSTDSDSDMMQARIDSLVQDAADAKRRVARAESEVLKARGEREELKAEVMFLHQTVVRMSPLIPRSRVDPSVNGEAETPETIQTKKKV